MTSTHALRGKKQLVGHACGLPYAGFQKQSHMVRCDECGALWYVYRKASVIRWPHSRFGWRVVARTTWRRPFFSRPGRGLPRYARGTGQGWGTVKIWPRFLDAH